MQTNLQGQVKGHIEDRENWGSYVRQNLGGYIEDRGYL